MPDLCGRGKSGFNRAGLFVLSTQVLPYFSTQFVR
jgi:hypothetical protein